MYIKYNNNIYLFYHGSWGKCICTQIKENADASFYIENGRYMKDVDDALYKKLCVYDVDFYCEYDINDSSRTNVFQADDISSSSVRLYDSVRYIPGWEIMERYLHYKDVPIDDIKTFIVEKKYYYVNGVDKSREDGERQEVSKEIFLELAYKYNDKNI